MKHQKIWTLLNEANFSGFVTRKWNIVNDNSRINYDVENEIIYNTEILKFKLFGYNNASITVKGNITIVGHQLTQVAFKNCAPFTKCITKTWWNNNRWCWRFIFNHASVQFNRI